MSGVATGLSQVNIDVQGLSDDEEQELEKEDEERERELHELLSTELPHELLDDDNLSFSSQGLSSSTHGHRTPEFNPDQSFEHHNSVGRQDPEGPRGTTYYEHEHPLLTRRGEEFVPRSGFPSNAVNGESMGVVHPESLPRGYGGGNYEYNDEVRVHRGFGGDNEGVDEERGGHLVHDNLGYLGSYNYQSNVSHTGEDLGRGGGDRRVFGGSGGDDDGRIFSGGGDSNTSAYYMVNDYAPLDVDGDSLVHPTVGKQSEAAFRSEFYETTIRADMNDNYKVQYTSRNKSLEGTDRKSEAMDGDGGGVSSSLPAPSSELAQLQVLYRARGRKLEEMSKEMAVKEEDYERQIRLLNHHLTLMKGERDGMASSLKHAQELTTESKNDIEELKRRLRDTETERERTNNEKRETECDLEATKTTIESLHHQLSELEKSESLSRAREQHENIVMATRKRYEDDVVRLKQKLDDVNNSLIWKNEESNRLLDELGQARKEADRVRLDRAETVNRLTRSLEQSQKQNEELLQAGSTQEISHLQSQLNKTQRDNQDLQEHCKTMEDDLVDLKDQLRIYESVSKLGFSTNNETASPLLASEGIKRNLEADDWRTPGQGPKIPGNFSTEEILAGLQKELQHSLASNRSKREEIQQLLSQLDLMKRDVTSKENERERLEIVVWKQEERVVEQEKKISDLEKLTKDPEGRDEYRESELKRMKVEDHGSQLEQFVKREKELEQLNLQLRSQITQMVREHDADKQKSIEQCRQSCLEFHDEAMAKMKVQVKQEYEEHLAKLRLELQTLFLELDQAKESYVALSEETRWLEKQTREQCAEETKQKIDEIQVQWSEAKSFEIMELRQTIVAEMEGNYGKEKQLWQKSEDELFKGKMEAELALAKMDWAKEQKKLREEAVASALKLAEKEWVMKYEKSGDVEGWEEKLSSTKKEWEQEKEKEIQENIDEVRKELQSEIEKKQDEKLSAAREEWDRVKAIEIEGEVTKQRLQYEQDQKKLITEAKESAVTEAKADWLKEQEEIRHNEISKAKDEAVASFWEREKAGIDMRIDGILHEEKLKWRAAADEQKLRALESVVLQAEQKWQSEHEDKISEAVKNALVVAQATWKKKRQTAIESAVSQSLQSAKKTWHDAKVLEIEQILSAARKQWLTEFEISKPESTLEDIAKESRDDREDELKLLETEYQNKLQGIMDDIEEKWKQKKALLEEDWAEKYEREREDLEDAYRVKFQKEREELGREIQENYEHGKEEARKKLEYELQERLQSAVESAKHDWEEEQEEDRMALEEQHLKKLETNQERLRKEMEEQAELQLFQVKNDALIVQRRLEQRLNNEYTRYKPDTEKLKQEVQDLKQSSYKQKDEEVGLEDSKHRRNIGEINKASQLQLFQVKNDALIVQRRLEQRLKHEYTRYKTDIEKLKQEVQDLKQSSYKQKDEEVGLEDSKHRRNIGEINKASQTEVSHDQSWISLTELPNEVPTLSDDASKHTALHEVRHQYLATTAQLKNDLMQHAVQTRKNATQALRTEVMKERHATTKRLRKYYLECLKQILDDDKQRVKNNQEARINEEKMKIMEERLRLPDEKDETSKSHDSTLTNVSALPADVTHSQQYSSTNQGADVASATLPSSTSSPKPEPRDVKQGYHGVQFDLSRDTSKLRTRPPRVSSAGTTKTKKVQLRDNREQSNEWVNFTRENKLGEAIDPGLNHPVLHDGKDSSKEKYGSNPRGLLVSSTESLLSFDPGGQIDLPPVIKFRQQKIPDYLRERNEEEESEAASGSERSKNDRRIGEKTQLRSRSERSRAAGEGENNDKQPDNVQRYDQDERTRKTRLKQDIPARPQPYVGRTAHPVIARTGDEQPTKLTSSSRKPNQ